MTTNKTDPEFHIRISGITFEDAVVLCGSKFARHANNWYASEDDDDCNTEGGGSISIPIRHMDDLMEILCDIRDAEAWTDVGGWQTALHAARITPTYALGASLTDTGCDLRMGPYKPAKPAVEEALTRLEKTIADVRAAACLLEEQP